MKKTDEQKGKYMEVWGDTVVPGELAASALICVITTMVFFLAGRTVLLGVDSLEPALAKGYACWWALPARSGAAICARKFPPKRKIMVDFQEENVEDILAAAGMTVEEEREALSNASPDIIREMENCSLYSLLALIPEGSPNYKPEYRTKVSGKEGQ